MDNLEVEHLVGTILADNMKSAVGDVGSGRIT